MSAPHVIMSETDPANPVLVEVIRGTLVESRHAGAIAVADADGRLAACASATSNGRCFPRSAVKAMQAMPLVESGAADAFGLGDDELAVACASHSGELRACRGGAQPARQGRARRKLSCLRRALAGQRGGDTRADARRAPPASDPQQLLRQACRHARRVQSISASIRAAMSGPTIRCRVMIARIISETCGIALDQSRMGIDGCSVPTWALPLRALARGFARLGTGKGLSG